MAWPSRSSIWWPRRRIRTGRRTFLDAALAVSGLGLPKAEKGMDEDATFLLNADACSIVADLVEALASGLT